MHELSITRNVVAAVAERAAGRPVKRVHLVIGRLSGVEVEAVRFCFDVCAAGTCVEGALLDIEVIDGLGRCHGCAREVPLTRLVAICPCERREKLDIVAGEELLVRAMEV